MRSKSTEELVVTKVENGIRSIKLGTKKPEDVDIYPYLEKLKNLNAGLYDELSKKYTDTLALNRIKLW